jgi:AraC-like DNA-binding protein
VPELVRRRVDWTVILGSNPPRPSIRPSPQDESDAILSAFSELLVQDDVDQVFKRAVELAREVIGLRRVALFLLDEQRNLMLGTWGTDLERRTVDEHHVMYEMGGSDRAAFERAESGAGHFTVIDNCPIVVQEARETRVVGTGWVAATPIRSARGRLGMLFNDGGLEGAPMRQEMQARTALLASMLGVLIDYKRPGPGRPGQNGLTAPAHPVVVGTLRLLAKDPSLGGKELADALRLSLSRLARVFKTEMGLSLVEYRNRLRLERFDVLVDERGDNLLDAALAAGFGSAAQFHRVFRALRGQSPRAYLKGRGH